MSQRDELMQQFGPLLLEAFGRIIFEDLNRLRIRCNMPLVSWEQFFTEINNHLSTLQEYDWMNITPPT